MAKRVRDFKRISMTAKTAEFLKANLVEKTLEAHQRRCVRGRKTTWPVEAAEECIHHASKSLQTAELITEGLKIGKKRATLDIKCPYSLDGDAFERCITLKVMSTRIRSFGAGKKRQLRDALRRISIEIFDYANRNAMQVLAEAAR